ncbi:MAG: hypothetical protein LV479_06145 [Methylacidiphilales bacterium]|nr:hypothetical protein [Candidatus Methylacidiphilales bacterium]
MEKGQKDGNSTAYASSRIYFLSLKESRRSQAAAAPAAGITRRKTPNKASVAMDLYSFISEPMAIKLSRKGDIFVTKRLQNQFLARF